MEKFKQLLRDFGYRLDGNTLIDNGVRGWIPPRIVGRFRDALDACDHLCPLIADPEFTNRLARYQRDAVQA